MILINKKTVGISLEKIRVVKMKKNRKNLAKFKKIQINVKIYLDLLKKYFLQIMVILKKIIKLILEKAVFIK